MVLPDHSKAQLSRRPRQPRKTQPFHGSIFRISKSPVALHDRTHSAFSGAGCAAAVDAALNRSGNHRMGRRYRFGIADPLPGGPDPGHNSRGRPGGRLLLPTVRRRLLLCRLEKAEPEAQRAARRSGPRGHAAEAGSLRAAGRKGRLKGLSSTALDAQRMATGVGAHGIRHWTTRAPLPRAVFCVVRSFREQIISARIWFTERRDPIRETESCLRTNRNDSGRMSVYWKQPAPPFSSSPGIAIERS